MRRHRGLTLVGLVAFALAACTTGASPSASSSPAASAGASTGASADARFAAIEAAAREEGKVVVWGPTSPDFQAAVQESFNARFPEITLEFTQNTGNEALARVKSEYEAGRYSVDVIIDGASTLGGLLGEGFLRPIGPEISEATLAGENWAGGAATFMDGDGQTVLVPLRYVPPVMIINSEMVDPADLASWNDIGGPEWTGKIAVMDPRIPSLGGATAWQLITVLGEEPFDAIYVDQDPAISAEDRQVSEWVARGEYAIGIGPRQDFWEPLREEGLPVETHRPDDFAGWISGGPALVGLLAQAPNPNAAVAFVDWLASKDGQTVVSTVFKAPSARTDVSTEGLPDYVIPVEGAVYGPNEWDPEWAQGDRVEAIEHIESVMGS